MDLPCEGPAQNGASNDAEAMDTGIGIINNPEIHPAMNQRLQESAVPPLEFPHPISLINYLVSQPSVSGQSPLTMPSTSTGTGSVEEAEAEAAAQQLVSIQNTSYEHNEAGIALSVPETTRQLDFIARDSYRDRYDSDGELGPFFDAVVDEPSDSEDEEELPIGAPLPEVPIASDQTQPTSNDAEIQPTVNDEAVALLDEEAVKKMTVAQLKDEKKKEN